MEITQEKYNSFKEQGLSRLEIANQFSIPEWKMKKLIASNKWGKVAPVTLNDRVFKTFTEESCYWAGFIAADGNVDSKGRIRIGLNYDDLSHLEKFKEYLQSTYTISINITKYYRCSFEFTHKQMVQDLKENFLIIPNKTDCLEFPSYIPEDMLKHYIRGYFDGDGSVCESFSNKASRTSTLYATFCSGSTQYAKDLFEALEILLELKGNLQEYPGKFQIKYCTNDAKKLLTWMYKDSNVYLDRKYNKYLNLVIQDNRATR